MGDSRHAQAHRCAGQAAAHRFKFFTPSAIEAQSTIDGHIVQRQRHEQAQLILEPSSSLCRRSFLTAQSRQTPHLLPRPANGHHSFS